MNKIIKLTAVIGLTASSIAVADNNRLLSSANVTMPPSSYFSSEEYNRGTNPVADPGFEGGSPNAAWDEASTNFGSPICDEGSCGNGGTASGPNSGSFWAWLGGIAASEVASVSQSVTFPNGSADLTFMLNVPACDSADDFMSVQIDGNEVFRIQGDDATCGTDAYTMKTVDVSAFSDGGAHTILFTSEFFATNGAVTNFMLDDIAIEGVVPVELMNFSVE